MKSHSDFISSVGYENFKNCVENYFDHLMAVYQLCGNCNLKSVYSNSTDSIASFIIEFYNDKEASTLYTMLNSNMGYGIKVYDKWFVYKCEQIDLRTLRIKIYPYA